MHPTRFKGEPRRASPILAGSEALRRRGLPRSGPTPPPQGAYTYPHMHPRAASRGWRPVKILHRCLPEGGSHANSSARNLKFAALGRPASGLPPGGQPRCDGASWLECDLGLVHTTEREHPGRLPRFEARAVTRDVLERQPLRNQRVFKEPPTGRAAHRETMKPVIPPGLPAAQASESLWARALSEYNRGVSGT